jgi:uncharacterized protein YukE
VPLDTKVDGDPASIRSTAGWLQAMSDRLDDSARLVHQAGAGSEGEWKGPASEAFRATMTGVKPRITVVAEGYDQARGSLNAHADSLSSVQKDMERAKQVAGAGGLTVTGDIIYEPTQPPSPTPLGKKPSESEKRAHKDAEAAVAAYNRQSQAYQEAAEIVKNAREEEDRAIETLKRALNFISRNETGFTADLTAGLAGASFGAVSSRAGARASKFRGLQSRYEAKAAQARARYAALRAQRIGRFNFIKKFLNPIRQGTALASAESATQQAARAGATAESYAAKAGRFAKVGKVVPFAGTAVAVVGGINDYTSGRESAAQAATSTLGGIAAGAAAGALVGTAIPVPVVGTAAGAIVGAGVGAITSMEIDAHWDTISSGAESALNGAKNVAEDVGSALNPFD